MSDSVSRRRFLVTTGAVLGLGPAFAACGGPVNAASCEGYDTLTAQDLQTRATLNYVDETPIAGQRCDNCRFYNRPAGSSPCGGCQLFAGPVAPGGHCTSWAAQAA